MRIERLVLASLVCGCVTELPQTDPDEDTTTADTDEVPSEVTCNQTLRLDFDSAPDVLPTAGTSWSEEGVELEATFFESGYSVTRDASGCLVLAPGTLQVNLTGTPCAGGAARLQLTSTCGVACSIARAIRGSERVAEDRNTQVDEAEELVLTPGLAFSSVVLASLGATVCGIEIDQTPIPEELRPPDTGAPF